MLFNNYIKHIHMEEKNSKESKLQTKQDANELSGMTGDGHFKTFSII